jgi:hypothetical protein
LESVEKLNRLVEVLNKPFGKQELIDTVEVSRFIWSFKIWILI